MLTYLCIHQAETVYFILLPIYVALDQPSVNISSITATSITLSWSVPSDPVVDSYEVMWQRDTSGECPDEDEGSTTITDGSTSYTITELEEDSTYSVTVTAVYSIGNVKSNMTVAKTPEAGISKH